MDLLFKDCMLNYVNIETHRGGNTLDLILTDDKNLIHNVKSDINVSFLDHHIVICDVDISYEKENPSKEVIQYQTKVPNFGWKKGTIEQLDQYKESLNCFGNLVIFLFTF